MADYICKCNMISKEDIRMAVKTGADSESEVRERLAMKKGCGHCRKKLQSFIKKRLKKERESSSGHVVSDLSVSAEDFDKAFCPDLDRAAAVNQEEIYRGEGSRCEGEAAGKERESRKRKKNKKSKVNKKIKADKHNKKNKKKSRTEKKGKEKSRKDKKR